MIVHAYTMVHNEETLMPYFMRHYKAFCQKITVFDNESNDRTAAIASAQGAEVIPIATGGKHNVEMLRTAMNEGYKASRGIADWVICAEGDEFFWHPKMMKLLERYQDLDVTLPKTLGFDMVAHNPPKGSGQIYEELKYGFPNVDYSKRGVFRPDIEINFTVGGHLAFPEGPVRESRAPDILMLHYRYLGLNYFAKRYEEHRRRLSHESILQKWGTECLEDHEARYLGEISAAEPMIRQIVP